MNGSSAVFMGLLPSVGRISPSEKRVVGGHGEAPLPHRPGHHVEIIKIEAGRRADRVIAPRHLHHVAVGHRHRLVERKVGGVDTLHGKSDPAREAVVVGLLEYVSRGGSSVSCLCGG